MLPSICYDCERLLVLALLCFEPGYDVTGRNCTVYFSFV